MVNRIRETDNGIDAFDANAGLVGSIRSVRRGRKAGWWRLEKVRPDGTTERSYVENWSDAVKELAWLIRPRGRAHTEQASGQ